MASALGKLQGKLHLGGNKKAESAEHSPDAAQPTVVDNAGAPPAQGAVGQHHQVNSPPAQGPLGKIQDNLHLGGHKKAEFAEPSPNPAQPSAVDNVGAPPVQGPVAHQHQVNSTPAQGSVAQQHQVNSPPAKGPLGKIQEKLHLGGHKKAEASPDAAQTPVVDNAGVPLAQEPVTQHQPVGQQHHFEQPIGQQYQGQQPVGQQHHFEQPIGQQYQGQQPVGQQHYMQQEQPFAQQHNVQQPLAQQHQRQQPVAQQQQVQQEQPVVGQHQVQPVRPAVFDEPVKSEGHGGAFGKVKHMLGGGKKTTDAAPGTEYQ